MRLPAEMYGPGDLVLRQWTAADARAMTEAIIESADHLRPWMPWFSQEPLALGRRQAVIERWSEEWAAGGDVILGVFVDGEVAGGCGLHRRIGPNGLEIGYWIRAGYLRRGLATRVSGELTDAALALPEITHLEIRHDKANRASEGVPRKLGYELVGEIQVQPLAPAETGTQLRWRMDEARWATRARVPEKLGASE